MTSIDDLYSERIKILLTTIRRNQYQTERQTQPPYCCHICKNIKDEFQVIIILQHRNSARKAAS